MKVYSAREFQVLANKLLSVGYVPASAVVVDAEKNIAKVGFKKGESLYYIIGECYGI